MPEPSDKQTGTIPRTRWVHTLSGPWRTKTYGVVEFLRVHPVYRRIVAVLGVAASITAATAFGGLKIPGLT